jgi:FkbM family methyltransferase
VQSSNIEDYIVINKKNVTHKFVRFDKPTDHFVTNVFANWENETFDVFDTVKDPEGIAIDLGAWIGTTAIWLSKNFYYVVAVDADKVSLNCLKKNLEASECGNIAICERAVAQKSQKAIFGPRGNELNQSISYIKDTLDKSTSPAGNDYIIQTITFKQLIHDYVSAHENLRSHNVSFIKCDIEGGEEDIIEDMLYFAYHNKSKVYLSFHLDWWKTKKITDFEYIFKFFKTNCPHSDICEYLRRNPFVSLLFEPLDKTDPIIKKNAPAVIIGYNQYTYIRDMVAQLEKYTSDIIIIDNNSSYQPLLDYYANDFKYTLIRLKTNFGHTVYKRDFIQKLVGDLYILTDPDLQFNSKLPDNFIQTLIDISFHFKAYKVGLALLIDSDDIRTDLIIGEDTTVKNCEKSFWKDKLDYPLNPDMELYKALIDTTFCLVNKKLIQNDMYHIRVAGDYTCFHLPWHKEFKSRLQDGEYEAYLQKNISTNWFQ